MQERSAHRLVDNRVYFINQRFAEERMKITRAVTFFDPPHHRPQGEKKFPLFNMKWGKK